MYVGGEVGCLWKGNVVMTAMDMKRLNTWERKILKRVYGPVAEQGMWNSGIVGDA